MHRSLFCFLLAVLAFILTGCATIVGRPLPVPQRAALDSSLRVAAAALSSRQYGLAQRLYTALADHYPRVPEPWTGLAQVACSQEEWHRCEAAYLAAAEHSARNPELRADAFLGAVRASLSLGRSAVASRHLHAAFESGPEGVELLASLDNAAGVLAALAGDDVRATSAFQSALARVPLSDVVVANYRRVLIASGRSDEALRRFPIKVASPSPSAVNSTQPLSSARLLIRLVPECESLLGVRCAMPPGLRAGAPVLRVAPWGISSAQAHVRTLSMSVGTSRRLMLAQPASGVVVASPDVADVQLLSPRALFVIATSPGVTTVVVLTGDEHPQIEWRVRVHLDLSGVEAALSIDPAFSALVPHAIPGGVLVLSGEVASHADLVRALELVRSVLPEGIPVSSSVTTAAPRQVNLEVQIAEVRRSVAEGLGVSWQLFSHNDSGPDYGFRIGRQLYHSESNFFPEGFFNARPAAQALFRVGGAAAHLTTLVDALATAGLANVLARPNVTAISGEPASFFSGGEYPLPTGYQDGTIIFEYKRVGVLLDFVPTVISPQRIVLTVRPEVSEPSPNQGLSPAAGIVIPVINVRRAETTVEVADGESVVIAGLFRTRSTQAEEGVPGAKDLPGIGMLFGTTDVSSDDLELLVVVTPRLVSPQRADPGVHLSSPSGPLGGYYL